MKNSRLNGIMHDSNKLGGGEMFRTRSPSPVSGGPAIKAPFIALIRDGDAQVIDFPAERIHQSGIRGLRWDYGW